MTMTSASLSSEPQNFRTINSNITDVLGFNIPQNKAAQEPSNIVPWGQGGLFLIGAKEAC